MKVLISATCIAVMMFVAYYFYSEFQSKRTADELRSVLMQQASEAQQEQLISSCDEWIDELNSWKSGKPVGKADSFISARIEVENCLMRLKNTSWYDQNIKIKYW